MWTYNAIRQLKITHKTAERNYLKNLHTYAIILIRLKNILHSQGVWFIIYFSYGQWGQGYIVHSNVLQVHSLPFSYILNFYKCPSRLNAAKIILTLLLKTSTCICSWLEQRAPCSRIVRPPASRVKLCACCNRYTHRAGASIVIIQYYEIGSHCFGWSVHK
jgi:hypothetical protein